MTTIVRDFPRAVRVIENTWIPLADGARHDVANRSAVQARHRPGDHAAKDVGPNTTAHARIGRL